MSSTGNRSNPNQTRTSGHPSAPESSQGGAAHEGTHRETREHNKHNDPGQAGHKPQRHTPAQEKN
ncbi:MAG TPA: hypothetical protein VHG30_17690 [Microvirga sp.]|jgi:hypothetical protein|nr:hypothetical protein [Microvirga sp.]